MRDATDALIVIDIQNDFCPPGGALAVADGGDAIVPGVNALMADFGAVVLTQDWHPPRGGIPRSPRHTRGGKSRSA